MLIQFVLVDIRTLASADEVIELGEVFVHPNVYVLILNLANVHLPRARVNETGGSGPMDLLGCIVTVDRFVVVLEATRKQCTFHIVLSRVHRGSTSFHFSRQSHLGGGGKNGAHAQSILLLFESFAVATLSVSQERDFRRRDTRIRISQHAR